MTDFDTLTGAEALAEARRLRKVRADELRARRAKHWATRGALGPQLFNMLVRQSDKPTRLTWAPEHGTGIRRLRREALAAMRFARSPLPNTDTEYYSACGLADYYAEQREQARVEGLQLIGMYLAARREVHGAG